MWHCDRHKHTEAVGNRPRHFVLAQRLHFAGFLSYGVPITQIRNAKNSSIRYKEHNINVKAATPLERRNYAAH